MLYSRHLVPRLAVLALFALLLVGSTPAPAPRVPTVPSPVPGSYGERIAGLVQAEAEQLAALQAEFDGAESEAEATRIQRQIDLVKRSSELQLFELQLEEARRRAAAEAVTQLEPLVERMRRDLQLRGARYGLEVPRLQAAPPANGSDGVRP